MNLSPQQEAACTAVNRWLTVKDKPWFYLAGYAGSGKTTLAKKLSESAGNVLFAAFTGKATHVLKQKGCPGATTLHSLIYKPTEKSKERLRELQEELAELQNEYIHEMRAENEGQLPENHQAELLKHPLIQKLHEQIRDEQAGLKRPAFSLNVDSSLRQADLLVVDEVSMVNEEMADDILSFEVPVLVLGDPAQLPPVKGGGYFTERKPDLLLTEIHRQARDNPIIDMATRVRRGEGLTLGEYGTSRVIEMSDGSPEMYLAHDQVIVGRENRPVNRPDPVWRQNINRRIRQLRGFTNPHPVVGDKVICLRNNNDEGLLNGSLWEVLEAQLVDDVVAMTVKGEGGLTTMVTAHEKVFRGEEVDYFRIKDAEMFDYGYALTCHKAQGSQWESVLIFDQSRIFRQDADRWLYTAITRAAERVTVITT